MVGGCPASSPAEAPPRTAMQSRLSCQGGLPTPPPGRQPHDSCDRDMGSDAGNQGLSPHGSGQCGGAAAYRTALSDPRSSFSVIPRRLGRSGLHTPCTRDRDLPASASLTRAAPMPGGPLTRAPNGRHTAFLASGTDTSPFRNEGSCEAHRAPRRPHARVFLYFTLSQQQNFLLGTLVLYTLQGLKTPAPFSRQANRTPVPGRAPRRGRLCRGGHAGGE